MFIKCLFVAVFGIVKDKINVIVQSQNYEAGRDLKMCLM